jgi:D-serine deaminase-like pyridoxal phosphate-dependent protein
MTTLQELYGLCGCGVSSRATQQDLDTLGLLLDRLEEIEIYLETDIAETDRVDTLVEFDAITDRIGLLMEKV